MSKRNAQDENNDCVNNNNYAKNIIQTTQNVGERKNKMQCEKISKQKKKKKKKTTIGKFLTKNVKKY